MISLFVWCAQFVQCVVLKCLLFSFIVFSYFAVILQKWINFKSLMANLPHSPHFSTTQYCHSYHSNRYFYYYLLLLFLGYTLYAVYCYYNNFADESILQQVETLSYVYLHGKYVSISINITASDRILFSHTHKHIIYIYKYIYKNIQILVYEQTLIWAHIQ